MKSEGIAELKTKVRESLRKRYPTLPEHALSMPTYSDKSANGLTKCVIDYLKAQGHKAWRQGSEGRYRPGERITDVIGRVRQMKGKYLPGQNNGAADVAAIVRGLFVGWEIKMNDSQSDKQKEYQREIEASGGRYFICRSFDEFLTQYKTI